MPGICGKWLPCWVNVWVCAGKCCHCARSMWLWLSVCRVCCHGARLMWLRVCWMCCRGAGINVWRSAGMCCRVAGLKSECLPWSVTGVPGKCLCSAGKPVERCREVARNGWGPSLGPGRAHTHSYRQKHFHSHWKFFHYWSASNIICILFPASNRLFRQSQSGLT